MIEHIWISGCAIALIVFLEWKNLKKATKSTRWFTLGILMFSGALWVYIQSEPNHFIPSEWLHSLLEPFDPIS
ncbi:hypothetical protein [Bacillus sp. T33-2]|uniref:hypothetical protein n=1 Tax=Bacillus sp. T33-2 TaxID=2054168 RepID=UPI000C764272|nr:hypothetical protein [Bacillus sp. T33-2]PLR98826.1 hypothetical protein CVD19_04115 [Bacillus sp. T33-2]